MTFADLLAPLTLAEFRETYWNERPLLLKGRADRHARVPFRLEALMSRLSKCSSVKATFIDTLGRHREMPVRIEQVRACFDAGMTICMSPVEAAITALAEHCAALARSIDLCGTVTFSCYWSPAGRGFDLHYDNRPVFICQLEGRKRWWWSSRPALRAPIANFDYAPERLAAAEAAEGAPIRVDEAFETAVLEPGDLLYLPAGTWHRTEADGESSLGLTLRVFNASAHRLFDEVMTTRLREDAAFREPLPFAPSSEDHRLPPVLKDALTARLAAFKEMVKDLTVEDLARAWSAGRSDHSPSHVPDAIDLVPSDGLRVRREVILRVEGSRLYVHRGGEELAITTAPVLERALAAGEFIAGDVGAWEDVKVDLETLVAAGVLEVVSAHA